MRSPPDCWQGRCCWRTRPSNMCCGITTEEGTVPLEVVWVVGMVTRLGRVSVAGLEEGPATQGSQARRRRTRSTEEAHDPTSAAAQPHRPQRHPPPASPPSPR